MTSDRDETADPVATQAAWNAVLAHDRRFDGRFVYAVSSTRIYCRPSCPSRRPARHRVSFFPSPQPAEAAGFRACLRCRPQSTQDTLPDRRIEQARQYLNDHADETVTLRRLATMSDSARSTYSGRSDDHWAFPPKPIRTPNASNDSPPCCNVARASRARPTQQASAPAVASRNACRGHSE